jgi:LPXTG-motif cell wall-anchored protein
VSIRPFSAAAALLLVIGAAEARAQITTVIGPPKRAQTTTADSARREQVAQDSVARVTLTNMKEWVDSAAHALALRPDTGTVPAETPSTAPATVPATQVPLRPDSATRSRRMETAPPEFREGARAPNTATSIPTLALVGAALVVLGVAVGRRRRATDPKPGR